MCVSCGVICVVFRGQRRIQYLPMQISDYLTLPGGEIKLRQARRKQRHAAAYIWAQPASVSHHLPLDRRCALRSPHPLPPPSGTTLLRARLTHACNIIHMQINMSGCVVNICTFKYMAHVTMVKGISAFGLSKWERIISDTLKIMALKVQDLLTVVNIVSSVHK